MKPFKGTITDYKFKTTDDGEVYVVGRFKDHPQFHGHWGHTSLVVDQVSTNDPCVIVIETLNSTYRLEWNDPD